MVDAEIMRVDGVSGTTLTVTRQRGGTWASPHGVGSRVCGVLVPGLQYVVAFDLVNPLAARDPAQVCVCVCMVLCMDTCACMSMCGLACVPVCVYAYMHACMRFLCVYI